MFIPAVLTFILLHIAFGLAVGFFVLMFALKQEIRWFKILGSVFGWIIIGLSALLMLVATISAIKAPMYGPYGPMHQMTKQERAYKPCPNCPYQTENQKEKD